MTRFRTAAAAFLVLSVAAAFAAATYAGRADDDRGNAVAMRDDCDPRDPAWAPTGGCRRERGAVTLAEFQAELSSPLSTAVVGHQAWRNDPSYLKIVDGETLHVRNAGGRVHTLTEVAQWGGGNAPNPALNKGLLLAPECARSINIAPGESTQISGLAAGNHRLICCLHPWMRMLVKVQAGGDDAGRSRGR